MRIIDADDLLNRVNRKHSEVGKSRYTEGFNDAVLRFRSMIHSAKMDVGKSDEDPSHPCAESVMMGERKEK